MTAFLDTSVVVCYLTNDPPDMADRAARSIDAEEPLVVTDVVLVETAFVLASVYKVRREAIVDGLIDFIQKRNGRLLQVEKAVAIRALLFCCPSGRVSFPDAFLWAIAGSTPGGAIVTVDERSPTDGVEIRHV